MKTLIFAFCFVLLSCCVVVGQDVAELTVIRSLLGVPQNTSVSSSGSAAVPKDAPLKVYLDVSGDTNVRDKIVKDRFIQWIDEWGTANAANGITLELVSDPAQARIALVHFTDFPTEIVDQGADAQGGIEGRSPTGQQDGVTSYSSTIKMSMMVYTYIIIKEPDSLKLLYRRKDPLVTRSTIVASAHLTNAITAKLKKDLDKEIEKRSMKSPGEKDAKRPDYRLRDEFARWMTSSGTSLKNQ